MTAQAADCTKRMSDCVVGSGGLRLPYSIIAEHSVPWQLCGYGRSDWSTKLTRGLTSEAAAGFQSRRGLSHDDSAPVTPHNAPFPTYKAARVHIAARRRACRLAAPSARAADGDAGDRSSERQIAR